MDGSDTVTIIITLSTGGMAWHGDSPWLKTAPSRGLLYHILYKLKGGVRFFLVWNF